MASKMRRVGSAAAMPKGGSTGSFGNLRAKGLASHWDLVRMHFMEWQPRARAAARSRWYAAVDAAVAANVAAKAAQRPVLQGAAPVHSAEVPVPAASRQEPVLPFPASVAASAAQPASVAVTETIVSIPAQAVTAPARDGKPAAQGQGRLVSLVARATGSWRGPRPSLSKPPADRPAAPAAPPQLELQRSSSQPLTSQLRARFEGLAAVVAAPADGADGDVAARRRALGGFSRRRLQVSGVEAPRSVAVY